MAKLEVLVSLSGKIKPVEAWDLVPGLSVHRNPNPKKEDYWVTHKKSGLPVLVGVPGASIPWVKTQFIASSWRLTAEEIYASDQHRELVTKIIGSMAKLTKSDKQEIRIAKDIGGTRSAASGALPGLKRDQRNLKVLVESKTTDAAVFRVDIKDMEFLRKQACIEGKCPAYAIQIKLHEEVVLMPENEIYDLSGKELDVSEESTVERKTLVITEALARRIIAGEVHRFIVEDEPYLLMNYEEFLLLSKP
jgi:hypothetical protein